MTRLWIGQDGTIEATYTPATEDKVKAFMCGLCIAAKSAQMAEVYLVELQAVVVSMDRPWLKEVAP